MKLWRFFLLLLLTVAPQPLFAHGVTGSGLAVGLAHPVGGWDHLLAMVAVGIISAKIGGRYLWGVPLLFLLGMVAGFPMGIHWTTVPYVEWVVLLSVIGLGLFLGLPQQPPLLGVSLLVIWFGISHGYAHSIATYSVETHSIEWPRQISSGWVSVGFLGTTLGLHIMGGILGLLFNETNHPNRSFALAGTGITLAGVVLSLRYLAQTGII